MASPATIRDLLSSFSPAADFFALSSGDGRIKIWDAVRGHLQTEFSDVPAVTAGTPGELPEASRGHLSLDYTCMKWVQLRSKKKRKAGGSLLVLGTGSGDVLALDVAAGEWKWRVSDCHPGGVTAVAYSKHQLCVYTAGADGMVCQIDTSNGSILGRFRSSSKAISSLAVSSDGKILATAAGQLKTFSCSDNKKIQKFSGHPIFPPGCCEKHDISDDGEYILSSGVGERYVAIWKLGSGKTQSASCVLSMEHPAIFVDSRGTGVDASDGGMQVLAISEIGVCYFWAGNSVDDLRNKKPTKVTLSVSSISRVSQAFTIFAARLQGIDGPGSGHILLAYGSVVKPSFEKLLVHYGTDIYLDASQDGVLLPKIHSTVPHKDQALQKQGIVTALDRANAEDAVLPLAKIHAHEKKRKHSTTKPSGGSGDIDGAKQSDLSTTVHLLEKKVPVQRVEDDDVCIEDMMRECGIIDTIFDQNMENNPGIPTDLSSDLFHGDIPVGANVPIKKVRAHVRSMRPGDACKLFENLVCAWKIRSGSSEHILRWIYCLLVNHGLSISSQKSCSKLLGNLEKMTAGRYAATEELLRLSGRFRLIMAQVDKAGKDAADPTSDEMQQGAAAQEDEEEEDEDDEEIDEMVYGEDADSSEESDDDAE